ncbi:MAG: hypothetical protein ICV83_28735, partial [Cytophagales bacterium]|nr:hypothetical protein [Cytophagales bacterium]
MSNAQRGPQWLAFLLLACLSLFSAGTASAQDPGVGGTRSNFEMDADFKSGFIPAFWNASNYTPTNKPLGDDWSKGPSGNAVLKQSGGVSVPGVTDDRRSIWKVDGNSGTNSAVAEGSTFSGGSNKNGDNIAPGQSPYLIQLGGSTPQKNDITNTYLHGRTDSDGNLWIFFAAETRSTDGASYLDFEYNQAGVSVTPNGPQFNLVGNGPVGGRTVGDVLLVINYTGGGNRPVVGVRTWQANATWSDELPLADIEAFVTTNATNVDPVAPNRAFTGDGAFANVTAALQMVEGGINITSLNLGSNFNPCSPVSTVTVKTRSSPSYTSELKDYDVLQFSAVPPSTLTALSPATKCETENAVFSTTVEGEGALAANVQWYFNNVLLGNGGKYAITTNGGTSTLTVSGVSPADAGAYKAVLTGSTCGTPETSASLTINAATAATDLTPLTKCAGESAAFTTTASGTGPFTYVWKKNGNVIPNQNGASLTISPVTEADEANYTVEVTGACGTVTKSAGL